MKDIPKIEPSKADQELLAKMLEHPPEPTPALKEAYRRYKELTGEPK